ncbi:MAG: ornithine carbamoyltransferase, partial [Gammaproteobacteria bacterium]
MRHFLTLRDLSPTELRALVARACELKTDRLNPKTRDLLRSRCMVMIFEKSSTRTRVSFEVACAQFGGTSIFLSPGDSQMSRGESVSDTARILSSMADLIVMRTGPHDRVMTMAEHSTIPVINALSDTFHPCQLLADLQTFHEYRGEMQGARVAFLGDGSSNVCQSWINAAAMMNFELRIGAPEGYHPQRALVQAAGDRCQITTSAQEAVSDVDLVITDTWTGMGQEDEKTQRLDALSDFQVNQQLMSLASKKALFMHCLPAYRGQEVSAEVLEGPQ